MTTIQRLITVAAFLGALVGTSALTSSSCTWLHSGTPAATAATQAIDCTEAALQGRVVAALPDVLVLLISAASGQGLTWAGLTAALGGLEAAIAGGVAVITCAVDAAATYLTQVAASQPALRKALAPGTPAAATLAHAYLAERHRTVSARGPVIVPTRMPGL